MAFAWTFLHVEGASLHVEGAGEALASADFRGLVKFSVKSHLSFVHGLLLE